MAFHSIRSCFITILLYCLCGSLPARQWLTVSEGNTSSPYYTFKTTANALIDISTYSFERGQRYAFAPQGVSSSHPFMIGEQNGDLNSSLISVVGGGTPIPLTYTTSNLQITIPSNYSGDLVYFSTANTSVHYHLKIVDPPGGSYQSPSGTYQPVYDLNSSHISSLAVHVANSMPGKYAFFNHNNNNGSSEIRFNYMHVSNNQWQDASLGYYVAKPGQFSTIPQIYDHLHSINLSPVNGYKPAGVVYQSSGGGNQSSSGGTIAITDPGNGSNADANSDLTVTIQYASGGGGSQTPTWAYRIDSGFPGYGSPHGGTQVTGVTSANDFLSGQASGSRQINVALLDQAGNLHNPPIVQTLSVNYQSGGGGNNTPQYETQSTLMVDQSTSNTGIPYPGSGTTWYQSFTAVNPSKLQKFAFVTNGAFTASATVKIREGEGVTGNVLHTGTWTGIGSNTNTYNEYVIDNDVVLTQGQKYTIQLENQTSGGFLGSNANQYDGGKFHHSGYGGEYGDLKMKIWVLLQTQPTGGTIAITAPGNGSNADPDTDLTVSVQYASGSGGYQTPTWAYRIDSGFPGYGSPHGGTQVSGVTSVNNFLNGQANGNRQVNIALLDQAGNLHNPPVVQTISVNYQSASGGYQTGGNGYQTGGGDTIVVTAPGNGSNADSNTDLTVTIQYASGGGGSQTPTWAYRIDSGFPGYGSQHGGTQVTGVTTAYDFLNGQANGVRQIKVALLDQAGNLHNPPIVQTLSLNYQSGSGGYQTGGNGYQTGGGDTIVVIAPGNGSNADSNTDLTVTIQYASGGGGYQTPTWAYRIDSGFPGYGSPHGGTQVTGVTTANDFLYGQANGVRQVKVALLDQAGNLHNPPIVQTLSLNYQSGSGGYQTGGNGYQTGGGDTIVVTAPGNGSNADSNTDLTVTIQYASGGGGYQTPTWAYRIDSGFPAYGSPHGGTQVTGVTTVNDFLKGQAFGIRHLTVALLDQVGNLHNPPIAQSLSVNYQSNVSGYQTGNNGYQTPNNGYQTPGNGYQTPSTGYQTPSNAYQSPSHGYQTPSTGYQTPSNAYQSPSHGYQTPTTGYQTPEFGYQTPGDGYDPMPSANQISQVMTLGHQVLNSSILLSGELLDQNTSTMVPIEVGFLVSSSMQISPNDPLTQKISAERDRYGSFNVNFTPTSNLVLYFKAYAQSRGQTNFGNIRKIEGNNLNAQNQTPYQEALSILAVDSIQEDGGWIRSPWFGRYKNFNNGWIYHSTHGWLYLASDNLNGIWAWSETRAWVWSNKEVYPFLYQSNIENWIYVLPNKNGEARYYNYSTNLFEVVLP